MFVKRSNKNNNTQSGNVLLLALFVLSAVMLGATALGNIIIRDIKAARSANFSQVAFYAAETGSERALYELRKQGLAPADLAVDYSLSNDASGIRVVTESVPEIFTKISRDGVYEVPVFDPSDYSSGGGVEDLVIDWEDNCGGDSVIEVGKARWNPVSASWEGDFTKFRYRQSAGSPVSINLIPSFSYRIPIRVENCDATTVRIRGTVGDPPTPVDLPGGTATVISTGTFGDTKQAVKMTVPLYRTLSGIFDFVLFSECAIEKAPDIISGTRIPSCP